MQTTLKRSFGFVGTGLHLGRPVRLVVRPAPAGHGIVFRRMDLPGQPGIPARWDLVEVSPLMTRLASPGGASVSTVEHLMAAFAGCGLHNALVEIDGPEVPIADGSAAPFVRAVMETGLVWLDAPLRAIEVVEPVLVERGQTRAALVPSRQLEIDFTIDFSDSAIGRQSKRLSLANGAFVRELSDSRTFCRQADVEAMHAQGLALGGTLENAVVVDGAEVLTPGGLRHRDEAVRHKMLDALGDLALAGAPIIGRYSGLRSGHALTNALLRALFARPGAWRMVTCDGALAARLPGVGLCRADLPAVA